MFALVNVQGAGAAMRVWVAGRGEVEGMVGVTVDGMVLVQWPGGDRVRAAQVLAGQVVTGLLGPADQVAGLRAALGLGSARHASVEPGLRLTLTALRLPEADGCDLRPVSGELAGTLEAWRADYDQELFAVPRPEAEAKAARDVARWLATDTHRVLWRAGMPVALTGFNAVLPEVVQVGAVYVPPALRGQGLARKAVGLHLAQARAAGVQRAVLFAATDAAERAYVALGFLPAAAMGVVLLDEERVIA